MVSQVVLNPGINSALGAGSISDPLNINNINSLSNPMTNPNNSYENDIMMKGMNFGSLLEFKPSDKTENSTPAQVLNPSQLSSVSEYNQTPQTTFQGSEQSAAAQEEIPKKSNIAKIGCAILGFFSPLANKTLSLFRGGKFKDLFKFKELAVTCPVLAVAGYGTGMLIDCCIDSHKSKKIDTNA